jgi:two-component system response regulator FixJ
MPEIDGIDLLSELTNREIKWPVIAITGHADIPVAVQAIKNGAIDLLEKPLNFHLLEAALGVAMEQLSSIKDSAETRCNARRLFERLSSRETEILALLIDGLPNKVVAHHLSLSVRTVEMHRANGLQNLKVKSIAAVLHLEKIAECKLKTLLDRI